jgi:hypothetical protein
MEKHRGARALVVRDGDERRERGARLVARAFEDAAEREAIVVVCNGTKDYAPEPCRRLVRADRVVLELPEVLPVRGLSEELFEIVRRFPTRPAEARSRRAPLALDTPERAP